MMDAKKTAACDGILELMRYSEVSVKDLSIRIAYLESTPLSDVQRNIKGFLYPDQNVTEP